MSDHLCTPNKIAYPCITPTYLLHSTHEQLDGVPVNPAEMAQGLSFKDAERWSR